MRTKDEILHEVAEALDAGVLTQDDVRVLVGHRRATNGPTPSQAETTQSTTLDVRPVQSVLPPDEDKPSKLTAVDVMFYVAGIVLFAAIMSMIVQSQDGDSVILRLGLSIGLGSLMWALALYLKRSLTQTDIRRGLLNSLLLTGSLCLIVGGYIINNELTSSYGSLDLVSGSVVLMFLAAAHVLFDRYVRRDLILLMGVLLGASAFSTLVIGLLRDIDLSFDVYAVIFGATALLMAYATRVAAKIYPARSSLRTSLDGFAAFIVLGSMFVASFGDYSVVWLVLLVCSVLGLFYLSILAQNRHLLGNAALFLVVAIITISFKYFSDTGATTSLIISAFGLLGSAAAAATINRKYFKPQVAPGAVK